jgi:dienelactone hydrolase
MTHEHFVLLSREGQKLRCDLRYSEEKNSPAFSRRGQGVVVFLHGFKGFKDWGPWPTLMERLADAGFITLAFNFSHNGIGDDLLNFTEFDRFARNTFTRDIAEVSDILRAISENKLPIDPKLLDSTRIGLVGHSRGAATAILAARHASNVKAVCALAPVASFERWTPRQAQVWRDAGYTEITNQRTGQVLRLNSSLLDDYEQNRKRLNILEAAHEIAHHQKQLLVIAGAEDLTAPLKESEAIVQAAQAPTTELQIIPHTGHTFGTEHPFKGTTRAFEEVVQRTISFFERVLVRHNL